MIKFSINVLKNKEVKNVKNVAKIKKVKNVFLHLSFKLH